MGFFIECIFLVISGLLGAFNISNAITDFIDGHYFTSGLSFMGVVVVITFMVKSINRF